jgi:plastocyanin
MGGAQHTEQCPGPMLCRRPIAAALAAAALALTAGGCTDDAPPAQARGGRVDVTLDDYSISPQRIRAKAGRIAFHATNRGKTGHTLHVLRGDREVVAISTLLPGQSGEGSGTFTRGEYKLVCILGNHEELGMYGTLTVR